MAIFMQLTGGQGDPVLVNADSIYKIRSVRDEHGVEMVEAISADGQSDIFPYSFEDFKELLRQRGMAQ